jgi:hypothetical protein
MNSGPDTEWHFYIMIAASLILFITMIWIVLDRQEFILKRGTIVFLALVIVVIGMLLGKYGAKLGFAWWVYYPVPMLMTVLLPPLILKFNRLKTMCYLAMSLVSAPLIHASFSFFLGWKEFMPFWNIPSIRELIH